MFRLWKLWIIWEQKNYLNQYNLSYISWDNTGIEIGDENM